MKMRLYSGLVLAVQLFAVSVAGTAQAGAVPRGSYLQSCSEFAVPPGYGGTVLTALCRTTGGGQKRSSLYLGDCKPGADISNQDGLLYCASIRVLHGSYEQSCSQIAFEGGVLTATCRSRGGVNIRTFVIPSTCGPSRDIANIDGHLVCIK